MIREAYGWFGLEPRYAFATRPDGAIGDPALWDRAEGYIKAALEAAGVPYTVKPKDGTFYAPKIDIYIDDALGREWQMATIQADLTMLPERFDLSYIDEEGKPQRPIAIHRAIYGSLERFIGILVEHFGGRVPALGRARPGRRDPDRGPPRRRRPRARRRPRRPRAAGRGGRFVEPDAVQDPDGAGAEGAVHGRPRRPRDRGPDGVAADACRGAAAGRGLGRIGRPAGRGGPRATRRIGRRGAGGSAVRRAFQ